MVPGDSHVFVSVAASVICGADCFKFRRYPLQDADPNFPEGRSQILALTFIFQPSLREAGSAWSQVCVNPLPAR